jgi:acyl-CoA thioesterase II
MSAGSRLFDSLALEDDGDGRFRAPATNEPGVVFGGQLLAQSIMAAAALNGGKEVKTIHTVFARAASTEAPLEYDVEVLQSGRAFASASVTARQGDRLCTRSTVLSSAAEPDLIRHAEPMPDVPPPSDVAGDDSHRAGWHIRTVDGVDVNDPAAVGPALLDVWTRFDVDDADLLASQALLAYASDGFLIGTAMRPHEGVGQSLAHVTLSTGVITHTLTFHEPFDASQWLLLSHAVNYAGRGRTYGRADVFTEDGRLVASFVQDAMVRPMPEGHSR